MLFQVSGAFCWRGIVQVELLNDFLKVKKPEISSLLHISLYTDTLRDPASGHFLKIIL